MKIQPIFNYNTQIKKNFKVKVPIQNSNNDNKLYNNNPVSFGFNTYGITPIDTRDIRTLLGKNKIKKTHLEQVLNFTINDCVEGDIKDVKPIGHTNLYNFGSRVFDYLWQINYNDEITVGDLAKSLKEVLRKEPSIIKNQDKISNSNDYHKINSVILKRTFSEKLLQKLSSLNQELPLFEGIKDRYGLIDNIAQEIYTEREEDYKNYVSKIRKLVQYKDDEESTKFDVKEELEKLPPKEKEKFIKEYGEDINEMCLNYLAERGSLDIISMPSNPNLDTAILQTLPRYDSTKSDLKRSGEFEIEPLYRWLKIDNLGEFLEQFKIGGKYSYPKSQSCSKQHDIAELSWYGDYFKDQFVKFRIHPKGKTSKAYDVKNVNCNRKTYLYYDDKEPRYRTGEAIYPANTKFKVLGIYKNFLNTYTHSEKGTKETSDNFKIIIDLQEM